ISLLKESPNRQQCESRLVKSRRERLQVRRSMISTVCLSRHGTFSTADGTPSDARYERRAIHFQYFRAAVVPSFAHIVRIEPQRRIAHDRQKTSLPKSKISAGSMGRLI